MSMSIFYCSRGRERTYCSTCNRNEATTSCQYPLRGAKLGTCCAKALCEKCRVIVVDTELCQVHARVESAKSR